MSTTTNIDLYMQELEDSKVEIKRAIIAKGVTPTGGLSSYAEAVKRIPTGGNSKMLPLSETITENGEYNFNPIDDGVEGYNRVSITVDTPTYTSEEKSVTITKNGTQSIIPSEGYDGLSKVDVTVNVASTSGKPQIPNGFRFTGGDIAQVDFSQYDWSMVYDTSNFFQGCTHSTGDWSNFEENFNGKVLTCYEMFGNPSVGSNPIISIPQMDTSEAVDMYCMFWGCNKLTSIPQLDTSNVTRMHSMFYQCTELSSIPLLDTSKVTDMTYMFYFCPSLISIPQLDTSNVTRMDYMFSGCQFLTTIPQLDTSKVTSMLHTFNGCSRLSSIPQLDTSKVTSMENMFANCSQLTTLPDFNSVKVANFGSYGSQSWLYNCTKLQKIGIVDCDSVTSIEIFFGGAGNTLTEFGGCRNLGKTSSVSGTSGSYFMTSAPNLNYESVMNVINGLYDRATAGLSVLTLKLHANHLAMLSEDDIAIATNKGWNLTA